MKKNPFQQQKQFAKSSLSKPFLLLFALLFSSATSALTFVVGTDSDGIDSGNNSTCQDASDLCTLRMTIQRANLSPGTHIIELTIYNPTLSVPFNSTDDITEGDLDITSSITIRGADNTPPTTTITGDGSDRVFHISGNNTVAIENVIIQGGNIHNSKGAGIKIDSGTVTIFNTTVQGNGSVEADLNAPEPNLTSTIAGGGIYIGETADVTIMSSTIEGNTALSGGGIEVFGGRVEIIDETLIDSNLAGGAGGAGGGVQSLGGFLNIGQATISNNTASTGGGIYTTEAGFNIGSTVITGATIDSNNARIGGGIFITIDATISHTTISRNTTVDAGAIVPGGNGGGIYISGVGSLNLFNSTVSSNVAYRDGGGIFTERGIIISDSTLYENRAEMLGDNYELFDDMPPVGGNQITVFDASTAAPDVLNDPNDPSVTFSNTIIADGNSSNAATTPCAGTLPFTTVITTTYTDFITTDNYNIEGSPLGGTNSCGLTGTDDLTGELSEPASSGGIQLGPLFDNDGPTETHAIPVREGAVPTSVADRTVGDPTCPTVDQRFFSRLQLPNCTTGAVDPSADTPVGTNTVDLQLTLSATPDPAKPNDPTDPVKVTFTVQNLYFAAPAHGAQLIITLPSGPIYNGVTSTDINVNNSCAGIAIGSSSGGEITCNLGSLQGLELNEVFLTLIPTSLGILTVTASATSTVNDSRDINNTDISTSVDVTDQGGGLGTNNFGGSSGSSGGGTLNPLFWLILGPSLYWRMRRYLTLL